MRPLGDLIDGSTQEYPIRTLLQTLYPHEPSTGRDRPPVFCKDFPRSEQGIMYVPHLWSIIIGTRYLLTCSECDRKELMGNSIVAKLAPPPLAESQVHHGRSDSTPQKSLWEVVQEARAHFINAEGSQSNLNKTSQSTQVPNAHGELNTSAHNVVDDTKAKKAFTHWKALTFRSRDLHEKQTPDHSASGSSQFHEPPKSSAGNTHTNTELKNGIPASLRTVDIGANSAPIRSTDIRSEFHASLVKRFGMKERPFFESILLLAKPQDEDSYFFSTFVENVKGLFHLPFRVSHAKRSRQYRTVVTKLGQCSNVAIAIEAVEQLEGLNGYFEGRSSHRDAIVRRLSLKEFSYTEAMRNLIDTLELALRLLGDILDSYLHFLPSVKKPSQKPVEQAKSEIAVSPFLTWGLAPVNPVDPSSEEALSIHAKRLESEHLLAILEDTERNILEREKSFYQQLQELDLIRLEEIHQSLSKDVGDPRKVTSIGLQHHNSDPPVLETPSTYRVIKKATEHLKRHHFQEGHNDRTAFLLDEHDYYGWICTEGHLRNEVRIERQLSLLRSCLPTLTILRDSAAKIHREIVTDRQKRSKDLALPTNLVRCFEETALYIIQTAVMFVGIKDECRASDITDLLEEKEAQGVHYGLLELVKLGRSAQQSMTDAEKSFARSDSGSGMVNMRPAGPEFLVAMICQNLQERRVLSGSKLDINGLYQQHTSKLKYQVHRYPRKRLLPKIHALQDELTVVQMVNGWQQEAYTNFMEIMDVNAIKRKHDELFAEFVVEKKCLKLGLRLLRTRATEIEALTNWTRDLRDQLKESMEILEEDHGKAIMVFTMVTTIFLPL
ncbi:hypothetical protein N0V90_007520 [Kalmusia sp. IMI 367209]|nr:hypothetical protein N0V90_007520 [Kalmusia sp. IMI 367209]